MSGQAQSHMLTTIDNPYDPFTQFDEWLNYDSTAGYYTPALLARLVHTSDALSESDEAIEIENTIDEIVKENVLGIYKKVSSVGV